MHNIRLIARREYIERVRTRGFVIITILIPIIMLGFIVGSIFLGSHENTDRRIAVVSSNLSFAEALQAELQKPQPAAPSEAGPQSGFSLRAPAKPLKFTVDVMEPAAGTRALLDQDLDADELDGYLWIQPASAPGSAPAFSYESRNASDQVTRAAVIGTFEKVLREQSAGRSTAGGAAITLGAPQELPASHQPRHHDNASSMLSIGVLFFLMYFVITLNGMNVARSVIEEKTSRIFEVMLAAVRPEEMMAGKILGVGAVGLTQVAIWLLAGYCAAGNSTGLALGGETIHLALTGAQLIYFFVFFLLGYLFYSSIAAALGAMTNSEQELQQLNIFLILPLIFCFVATGTMIMTPDAPIARTLALIPPFTPLLMYMRVSLGHPAAWEVVLSIALLVASIAGLVWLTSRIYRVGVLMYGKRPNLSELLRWLKYS